MQLMVILASLLVLSGSTFAAVSSHCKNEAVSAVKAIHNLNKGETFNTVQAQADRFVETDTKQYKVELYEGKKTVQSYKVVVKETEDGKLCKINAIKSLPTY